ncbi:MAG: hypothetical protein ACKOW2_01920 [Sphingobacteriaceae bacterium]
MKNIHLTIILVLLTFNCFSQSANSPEANQYLSIGTGITWDNYYSAGPRLLLSYSKRFKNKEKTFWGFTIDNKWRGLSGIPSLKLSPGEEYPPELNYNHLSFDLHSISRMGKTKIKFDFSTGIGAIYLYGEAKHAVLPTINIGMTMNIRLGPKLFLETSPLFIFPPTRITISPNKLAQNRNVYSAWHFLPLGLRYKLD